MRNILFIFFFLFDINILWGEAIIVGVDLSENESEIIVGGEKCHIEMKYRLISSKSELEIGRLFNGMLKARGYDWLVLVEMKNGIMTLEIETNESQNSRICDINCNGKVYKITQLPKADIKEFNVFGSGNIIPNMIKDIILDGSETGVTYYLCYKGNIIKSLEGTGNSLIFTTVVDYGTYTIKGSQNGNEKNMKGSADFTWFPVVNHVTLVNFNFREIPARGVKVIGITVNYDSGDFSEYKYDLETITHACNEGRVQGWNPEHILKLSESTSNKATLAVTITPNLLAEPRESILYLTSDGTKGIYLSQLGGGELIRFNVFGDNFMIPGNRFSINLDGSQPIKYGLYKNGLKIKETIGDQKPLFFPDLTEPGEYTIKAESDGQTFDMNGSVLVRDININPPHMREEVKTGDGSMVSDITYYDGNARPVQQVSVGASPGGKDIVNLVIRDGVGREAVSYLPYVINGNGNYRPQAVAEQNTFFTSLYGNNPVAYTSRRFDNGPNDRVVEQSAPGYSWRLDGGHTTRFSYRKNTASDNVKRYILEGTSVRLDTECWPAESLSVKEVTGTQGDVMLEYSDVQGNLVAKESRLTNGKRLFTHEIRDLQGRLRYVIPPLQDSLFTNGTKSLSDLLKYCYYTEYDEYGRVYKQYNPGGGYVLNLYDKRGRLVFVQDEKQRENGKWSFTKYDELDRPVISGVCTGTETGHKAGLQSQTVFGEQRGTVLHGYTNQTYPTSVSTNDCYIITYYDDYNWSGQTAVAYSSADAIGETRSNDVLGLVTGTKNKVLGITTNQWLVSAEYYDKKYRSIQSVSQLYPSGTEITSNAHDFVGQVTRVKVKQTIGSSVAEYNKYFTYDQRGRVLKIEQQITGDNTNGRVTLVENVYDELGRVSSCKLHNGKEIQSHEYNVNGSVASVSSPAFSYTLNYDQVNVTGASARYDGNINAMTWKNGNGTEKAYVYSYDPLGQLESASYKEKSGSSWSSTSGKYNVSGLTYDLNGNMKSIRRNNSNGSVLHAINYTYGTTNNGNAISQITLNNTSSGTYVYDKNGNMTTDGYRGVTITYNDLDLPSEISKGQTIISYIYSARGEKLAQEVATSSGSSLTYYRGVMVYNGNALDYILHPAGVTRKVSSGYVYDYYLTDHLGSTRVVLEASGNTLVPIQTTEYYPFGLTFANNNLDKNKYLFSGKEIQNVTFGNEMLGMYDFGSRFYDPLLSRWFCKDPASQLASPYGYCANNPVALVDPDGEFIFGYLSGWFRGLFKGKNPFKEGFNAAINETKLTLGLFRSGGHQNIFQSIWEVVSRFTWQLPQTLVGYGYANYLNYTSDTKIDYYGGATTISTPAMKNAVTLGNYIAGNPNLKADPSNYLFQHEFGHYLQSKKYGPAYLSAFAIPSGISVAKGNDHKLFRVEQDANARAIKYFNKRGVLDWKFRKNQIGDNPYLWDMSNIYENASTRKFTDEFSSMLNSVMKKASFGDYFALFTTPLGVYTIGNTHYNSYKNIDWSVVNLNRAPNVLTGIRR